MCGLVNHRSVIQGVLISASYAGTPATRFTG